MSGKTWLCPCGTRNQRVKQKCTNPTCQKRRPKRRVPNHAKTLRDDSYAVYVQVANDVHGVTDESCCVCGRPRHESMRHHRDHDHVTGKPRGIVCFQCNQLMPRLLTVERARLILAYLERVEAA
jgi:hypothetical protein